MKKILLAVLALTLCVPLCFGAVAVKSAGTYAGEATALNFGAGTAVSCDGSTCAVTGTNTGSTAAITSGTITGVTINNSVIGGTTPVAGSFTTINVKQVGRALVALTPGSTVAVDATAGSVFTLTPGEAESINVTGDIAGQVLYFVITTSGTSSFTLTFNTGFKATGTLATGTADAKKFVVGFVCDGSTCYEKSRTAAM